MIRTAEEIAEEIAEAEFLFRNAEPPEDHTPLNVVALDTVKSLLHWIVFPECTCPSNVYMDRAVAKARAVHDQHQATMRDRAARSEGECPPL
jgi:hypothetical protein